jgi:hypothetical protein
MALSELLRMPSATNTLLLFTVDWFVWIVYCRTLHPLARVPGPVWPAVSRAWLSCPYFNVSYSRRNTNRRLVSERAHVHPYSGEGPMVTGFVFRLGEELVQKINHTNMILANSVPDVHRRC